jgi:hypothetical protein
MLVEIGSSLLITSYSPRADVHMATYWRDCRMPGQSSLYVLPTAYLDPIVTKAVEEGLTVLVRKTTR